MSGTLAVRLARCAVAMVSVLALVTACGGDDEGPDGRPEAQPAPETSEFAEGTFDQLPVPPRASPAGPRQEERDVTSRSWIVRNTTTGDVLSFYESDLGDEWTLVHPPQQYGDALRATWRRGDRALQVSAVPAPAAGRDEGSPQAPQREVQLSLQLGPPDRLDPSSDP